MSPAKTADPGEVALQEKSKQEGSHGEDMLSDNHEDVRGEDFQFSEGITSPGALGGVGGAAGRARQRPADAFVPHVAIQTCIPRQAAFRNRDLPAWRRFAIAPALTVAPAPACPPFVMQRRSSAC